MMMMMMSDDDDKENLHGHYKERTPGGEQLIDSDSNEASRR